MANRQRENIEKIREILFAEKLGTLYKGNFFFLARGEAGEISKKIYNIFLEEMELEAKENEMEQAKAEELRASNV